MNQKENINPIKPQNNMKTKFFHLIVLDESGSMSGIVEQTISGCNETINCIKDAQQGHEEEQEHYVSIYAFQSGGKTPSRYLVKNMPAAEVRHVTREDYMPYGYTPLYDAIGLTLTNLKARAAGEERAVGAVTIITDGMENSSKEYTHREVEALIELRKEMGWSINFIGANIDVEQVSHDLGIDSCLAFESSASGTREMFAHESASRMDFIQCCADLSDEDFKSPILREVARDYFKKGDKDAD